LKKMKVAGIIPAAGSGKRMGGRIKKQFLSLDGLPVLVRTVLALSRCSLLDELIIVTGAGELEYVREMVAQYGLGKVRAVVPGGKERQDSVFSGLLEVRDADYVLVHDGVRPFVGEELVSEVIRAAFKYGAAGVAVPVTDTIKQSDERGEMIQLTLQRDRLWAMQTPQVFAREILFKAYKNAEEQGLMGTDDAFLAEMIGVQVKLVPGHDHNIKITTSRDLLLGKLILEERRKQCE
jgi:2-C-methyl-D-erythritol 4-phosphate cytidylyltransferase